MKGLKNIGAKVCNRIQNLEADIKKNNNLKTKPFFTKFNVLKSY